jgi:serine/threonine-protein kinase
MKRIVLLAMCAVFTPAIVLAQSAQDKADAEALFNAGKAALAQNNFAEACPKLAESQKRDPAIGTALYLAECYERSGKMASAWALFHQAEDMANQRHDNRAPIAKARADRLVPSKLVVTTGADTPGLEVRRDGERISSVQFGLATPVDGGRHVIVATAPGKKTFEWTGEVPEQRGMVTVTIPPLEAAQTTPIATATVTVPNPPVTATVTVPSVPTTTPPPADSGSGGLGGGKIAGLVVGAVGLAVIGVGTTMGLVANGNYQATSSAPDNCTTAGCPTQAGANDRNSAKTLADLSTGVFIGGSIALVGGLVLFLVLPKPAKTTAARLTVTPLFDAQGGGAMLSGRF